MFFPGKIGRCGCTDRWEKVRKFWRLLAGSFAMRIGTKTVLYREKFLGGSLIRSQMLYR